MLDARVMIGNLQASIRRIKCIAPMDLSIIIINYNTHELVRDCLRSLLETAGDLKLEVFVVDNASQQQGIDKIYKEYDERFHERGHQLELIKEEQNKGFTGGNNIGLKRATAPYLLLLNNDTIVHEGALATCLEYMKADDQVGVVGPRLLNPDGSHQHSCRRFPSFRTALFNRDSLLTRLFPRNPWSRAYLMPDASAATEPFDVDWVSGAAMFISRRCLARVGMLDEAFFMYAEDVDWCKRACDAGFRVVYEPRATITHLVGQSSRHLPKWTIIWRHRSMWTFYKKHYSRRVALFDLITLMGISARCLLRLTQAAVGKG
jgi:GT2 family glycosyltransferase